MTGVFRPAFRIAIIASAIGLAGCVGAPAGPYGYGAPPPVALAPSYAAPVANGYAPVASGYAPVTQAAYGGRCSAGVYTCELAQGLPVGAQCSCPGLGAPSFGTVR